MRLKPYDRVDKGANFASVTSKAMNWIKRFFKKSGWKSEDKKREKADFMYFVYFIFFNLPRHSPSFLPPLFYPGIERGRKEKRQRG